MWCHWRGETIRGIWRKGHIAWRRAGTKLNSGVSKSVTKSWVEWKFIVGTDDTGLEQNEYMRHVNMSIHTPEWLTKRWRWVCESRQDLGVLWWDKRGRSVQLHIWRDDSTPGLKHAQSQRAWDCWGPIPTLLLISCVNTGKLFNLSEPQFLHLQNGVVMLPACCEN